MQGIKTKSKTGSYAGGTKAQVQGKSPNKSQQDLKDMSDDYANSGAALRAVTPVGNQSYADFQKNRKTPAGQKQKEDYETSNKLPRLTDADYQQRMFDSGVNKVKERANSNPTQSVFTPQARDAAYGAQNKASMEMGNQVSTDNGVAVTSQSLADRAKRLPKGTAYAAPGMNISRTSSNTMTPIKSQTPKDELVATFAKGTKNIKMTKEEFEDSPADKKADAKALKEMNKTGKYQTGTKGIKTKSGMSNFINGESAKVKNMSDADLDKSLKRNMNFTSTKQNAKEAELVSETVNRKYKKQGGYKTGTKGIKTTKMC